MNNIEQVKRDIQDLPAEAQSLLIDFVAILKRRYPKPETVAHASPYEKFKASGFIGCVAVEDNLSTTYKQVLADGWGHKYDHR